jgi:hypothetical protein
MTTTTKANSTPQNIDPNDPLLWFNPDALGVKPEAAPKTEAPKAKGFEKHSPATKLHHAVSGEKHSYTASGIIKSSEGVGVGDLNPSLKNKALAHDTSFSRERVDKGWIDRHITPGKNYARFKPEASGDRVASKKADEPKTPSYELRPGGVGQFESPFAATVRPRGFILAETRPNSKNKA